MNSLIDKVMKLTEVGYRQADIARKLRISPSTVNKIHKRALKLQEEMK